MFCRPVHSYIRSCFCCQQAAEKYWLQKALCWERGCAAYLYLGVTQHQVKKQFYTAFSSKTLQACCTKHSITVGCGQCCSTVTWRQVNDPSPAETNLHAKQRLSSQFLPIRERTLIHLPSDVTMYLEYFDLQLLFFKMTRWFGSSDRVNLQTRVIANNHHFYFWKTQLVDNCCWLKDQFTQITKSI